MSSRYTEGCARIHTRAGAKSAMIFALMIAKKYKSKPSVDSLMSSYGMSRATAYRWRAAWDYVSEDKQ